MKQQLNIHHNLLFAFFRFLYLNGKSFWIIYLVQNLCLPVCTMMSLQPGEPWMWSCFSPQLVKRSRWAMRTCQLSGWAGDHQRNQTRRILDGASNLKFLKTSEFQSQKLPFSVLATRVPPFSDCDKCQVCNWNVMIWKHSLLNCKLQAWCQKRWLQVMVPKVQDFNIFQQRKHKFFSISSPKLSPQQLNPTNPTSLKYQLSEADTWRVLKISQRFIGG